jgi:hypothetical protein
VHARRDLAAAVVQQRWLCHLPSRRNFASRFLPHCQANGRSARAILSVIPITLHEPARTFVQQIGRGELSSSAASAAFGARLSRAQIRVPEVVSSNGRVWHPLLLLKKTPTLPRTTAATERSRGMQCEQKIILAGKYVLGLLSEKDAADAERRIEADPEFRSLVAQWRDRLAELNDITEPIQPSSDLWMRIVRQLKNPPDGDLRS